MRPRHSGSHTVRQIAPSPGAPASFSSVFSAPPNVRSRTWPDRLFRALAGQQARLLRKRLHGGITFFHARDDCPAAACSTASPWRSAFWPLASSCPCATYCPGSTAGKAALQKHRHDLPARFGVERPSRRVLLYRLDIPHGLLHKRQPPAKLRLTQPSPCMALSSASCAACSFCCASQAPSQTPCCASTARIVAVPPHPNRRSRSATQSRATTAQGTKTAPPPPAAPAAQQKRAPHARPAARGNAQLPAARRRHGAQLFQFRPAGPRTVARPRRNRCLPAAARPRLPVQRSAAPGARSPRCTQHPPASRPRASSAAPFPFLFQFDAPYRSGRQQAAAGQRFYPQVFPIQCR